MKPALRRTLQDYEMCVMDVSGRANGFSFWAEDRLKPIC